jgi:hypothetical protein
MADCKFRDLRADEIECRVQQAKQTGVSLLLYKNARCDQAILDETVGPMNWQRHHCRDNANCIVSIWDDEKKQWIEKEDTGTESNTEAKKGLASDSFKRACFNWGIGRELYTAPFIWIKADDCEKLSSNGQRWICNDRFEVKKIAIENKRIVSLSIKNNTTGKCCFVYMSGSKPASPAPAPEKPILCEGCKQPIKPVKKRDGTIMTVAQVADWTKHKRGKTLCIDCERAAQKAEDKA